jgi:hypothetical protein
MMGTLRLLAHRIRGGSFVAQGEVLRAAICAGYWRRAIAELSALRLSVAVWLYWTAASVAIYLIPHPATTAIALVAGPLAVALVMALRHRSLKLGLFAPFVWHLSAIGLVLGFIKRRRCPTEPIEGLVYRRGSKAAVSAPAAAFARAI